MAARDRGYRRRGQFHDVYVSDPRRTKPERLKTIARMPISHPRPRYSRGGTRKAVAETPRTVEQYVAARSKPVRETLKALRQLVKSTLPSLGEGMKWGAPVYSKPTGAPLAYLYGGKDHANLGFLRGAELDDPDNLLEGSGVSGRHIKVFAGQPLPRKQIQSLLRQSMKLAPKHSD